MPSVVKKFRDLRYSLFYGALLDRSMPLVALGDTINECHWALCPRDLNSTSIVYSGGVGNDISFEHALVQRFGCSVVLLDPSPTGVRTMERSENRIPQFKFHTVALAETTGTLRFAAPLNPDEGSWFTTSEGASAEIEVPSTDLLSLMRQNGHSYIDLLKLDIEGSEYEVIEQIVREKILVRQICVEYHHKILPGIRRSQTIGSILKLVRRGYKLLHQGGNNHTFLKRSWPVAEVRNS